MKLNEIGCNLSVQHTNLVHIGDGFYFTSTSQFCQKQRFYRVSSWELEQGGQKMRQKAV